MARIKSFRGLRYNSDKVKISDVVTQPYDKISPDLRDDYYECSEYTTAKLIKSKAEDPYADAAKNLEKFIEKEVLVFDETPALYAYYQEYETDGKKRIRKGFVALVGLEDFETKIILPHERTLSGPKVDRLNLMKATNTNFGQIFMLYSDPENKINELLDKFTAGEPEEIAVDHFGDSHKLWKIGDMDAVAAVTALMQDKQLLIADGHHRYATACNYAKEQGFELGSAAPAAYRMMTMVNMDDKGLTVLPTHRLLHSLANFNKESFLKECEHYFEIEKIDTLKNILDQMAKKKSENVCGFYAGNEFYLLTLKNSSIMDELVGAAHSADWKKLDIAVLHTIILEKIVGISKEKQAGQENINYIRSPEKGVKNVDDGRYQALFLLNYTDVHEVEKVAQAGDVMPQKSTDFYPKLLSGMVFNKIN